MVVHTESAGDHDGVAVVINDNGGKELRVFVSDLHPTTEISRGHDTLEGYNLHDLVQLPSNEVGVIVRVGRNDLTVLHQEGDARVVNPSQLRGKRNRQSMRSMSLDNDGNHVGQGHIVQVISGPHYKGERGTVRHVHRAFVFLHAPTVLENGGYFVVRSRFCRRTATTMAESRGDRNSASIEDSGIRRSRSRRFNKNRDMLIGKTVRVIGRGKYKGQIGMVVDVCQNNLIKVKLHTERNKVKVERHRIRTMDEEKVAEKDRQNAQGYMGMGTPGMGGLTPGGNFTPGGLGSHTPGGNNTPGGYNATPSNTPGIMTPGMTPDAYGFNQPGTPMNPSTPGFYDDGDGAWDPSVSATPKGAQQYPISNSPTYSPAGDDISFTPSTPITGTPSVDYSSSYGNSFSSNNNTSTSNTTRHLKWFERRGAIVRWIDASTQSSRTGSVVGTSPGGFCMVRPDDSNTTISLLGRTLQAVNPTARDVGKKVLILDGVYEGSFAIYDNYADNECILRIYLADGSGMKSGMESSVNLTLYNEDIIRELAE